LLRGGEKTTVRWVPRAFGGDWKSESGTEKPRKATERKKNHPGKKRMGGGLAVFVEIGVGERMEVRRKKGSIPGTNLPRGNKEAHDFKDPGFEGSGWGFFRGSGESLTVVKRGHKRTSFISEAKNKG